MMLDLFEKVVIKRELDIGNAGFEVTRGLPSDTYDYLVGWEVNGYAVPQSTVRYSGNYAAAIAGGSYIVNSGFIPVLPGDVVRVSAAMYAESGIVSSQMFLMLYSEAALEVDDPSTTYLGVIFSPDFGGNYTWTVRIVDFTIPSPVRYIRVGFICTGSGYLYVDDVSAVLVSAMERVEVTKRAASLFNYNQLTVGTTPVQLTSTSTPLKFGVVIKADNGNSGTVYVGDSSVSTSNGFALTAGEGISFEIDNANKVWVVADSSGQKIYWLGL